MTDDESTSEADSEEQSPFWTPPEKAPEPPSVTPYRREPLWSYFLTPAAILVGSLVIAGVIWWVDEDEPAPMVPGDTSEGSLITVGQAPTALPSVTAGSDLLATFSGYAQAL